MNIQKEKWEKNRKKGKEVDEEEKKRMTNCYSHPFSKERQCRALQKKNLNDY
jgi:hypothetical protein